MQSSKIANHPFAVVLFPIQWRLPMLGVHFFPSSRVPPAKILVANGVDEFKIVADTDRRAIDRKIFEPDSVLRPFVVPRKWERPHPCGRFTGIPAGSSITQLKQPTFNLNHPAHVLN